MSSSPRSRSLFVPAGAESSSSRWPLSQGGASQSPSGAADPLIPTATRRGRSPLTPSDPLSLRLGVGADPPEAALLGLAGNGEAPRGGGALKPNPAESWPAPMRFGPCSCPACAGSSRSVAAATGSGGTTLAAPAAAVSLQTLADYLTTGFWRDWGDLPFRFNVTSSGIGANGGTLTYNVSGWANDTNGLSADRQALTREIFKLYSAVLGINFVEVTGSGGDIRFTDNDTGAYSYLASGWYADSARTSLIADYSVVNVEPGWYDGRSNYNTYVPQTIFHEVGHALGLGHQGQYNYTGTPLSYSTSAQFANDSWQATMMSYWDQAENPTTGASFAWLHTPMSVDWIALNDLYGSQGYGVANAFRGDTVYGVGTNISASVSRIWNEFSLYAGADAYTIVDGSGYDTINVSQYSVNQLIDLAPSQRDATAPSRSNIGGKIGNLTIAADTIIEAAVGGGGNDTFYGNAAANSFWGGGGSDTFFDSLGSDFYVGDAGSDLLVFSESLDLFSYVLDADALRFSRLASGGDVDLVASSVDTISFNSVAYTYQQLLDGLGSTQLPSVTIQSVNGLASGAITNVTSLNLQGSLSQALAANQEIAVYRDGIRVGTASLSGQTGWTLALSEAAGTSTIAFSARVLATDSGEAGLFSAPFQLTVDTVAPVVGVDSLQTFDTTPLISGTVNDPAAQVSVSIGAITRAAINNGNGTWSLQWNDVLAPGSTYDVLATASDAAGNSSSDTTSGELVLGADDFSSDGGTTGLVTVGGSASGVLEYAADHDWFGVDLQPGRTYTIRLNGTTLPDPYLRLYSPTGSLLASNDDAQSGVLNSLLTYTPTSSGRFYLDAAAYNDSGTGGYTLSVADVTAPPSLYFSLANSVSTASAAVLGGLTANTNDILSFNGSGFQIWLNGNASGLSGAVLRDFEIVNANEVVVAFNAPVTLAGIAFEAADLARITRSANGVAISMFFDGSDVGLTTASEAIDAVTGLADGSWLLSTRGSGSVPVGTSNLSFAPEDLLRFVPSSLGSNTAGAWSLYADMSDVGLSTSNNNLNENVVAVDVAASGRLVMATQANASASGLSAANEDAFGFLPSRLGASTAGAFQSPLLFDGSVFGLSPNALMGLDLPA